LYHGGSWPKRKDITVRNQNVRNQKQSGCASFGCSVIALVIVFVAIVIIAPLTEFNKTLPQQPAWYQRLEQQVHKMIPSLPSLSNSISKPLQHAQPQAFSSSNASSSYTVIGAQSLTGNFIDKKFCDAHSPACGTGHVLHDLGLKYNIDAVYPLAFFWQESNYGTQGVARYSKSIGNLRCIPSAQCVGGYAYFPSWEAGYEAWYKLITSSTYTGGGRATVAQIIPTYAPTSDGNNPAAYIAAVQSSVNQFRSESK